MRSLSWWFGLALSLAACGDDGDAGAGGAGSGAGTGGAGGEDHAYIDLPMRSGTVTVFESHVEGVRETNLIGAFLDIEEGFPGACADEPIAGCTVTYCKSGTVARESLVDAGSLSLTFGSEATPLVTYRNTATGFYLATLVDDELLTTGLDVQIETSGGIVPPFVATIPSPPEATLTSPLPPEGGHIPAGVPFDLAWTADDDAGELVFVLRAVAAHENVAAECAFDVAAGSGQVPAEVLAAVAGLAATQSITLEVETRTHGAAVAEDYAISLALVVTALSGDLDALRSIGGLDP